MTRVIPFDALANADLIVDAVYESSSDGMLAGEPISKLLPGSGNMGGFRVAGRGDLKSWVILFSTGEDPDWPDVLDLSTGRFDYYGDNRQPGHELHETRAGGNRLLRFVFAEVHAEQNKRARVSPFFVFKKFPTATGARSVQFKGLAVPGYPSLAQTDDLVAIWKTSKGQRFQNYRAAFTILDIPVITRAWINDLCLAKGLTPNAPTNWIKWKSQGTYVPLVAKATTEIRSLAEQAPDTPLKQAVLEAVWTYFKDSPIAFEAFAARVFQMLDSRVVIDEVTRGSVDGGRDAIGRYLLGLATDPVYAEFSLEAKCYRPASSKIAPNTVGVKEVSRLISRIRHRQFGVLVTTSAIARQAYEEVREDRHPIIFISGRDIAEILIGAGYNTLARVSEFLNGEFKV